MMHKTVQVGSKGLNGGGEAGRGSVGGRGRCEENYNNPVETRLEQRERKGRPWGSDSLVEGRDKGESGF